MSIMSSGNVYNKPDERTWMLPFSPFSTALVLRGTWTPSSTNQLYAILPIQPVRPIFHTILPIRPDIRPIFPAILPILADVRPIFHAILPI